MVLTQAFPRGLICSLFFILIIYGTVESASLKNKDIKIKISYQPIEHGNFNTKKFKLNHPVKILRTEIEYHLLSLKYKEDYLGSKEEKVFSKPEIKKMVPILEKAFKGVGPDKIIHFELRNEGMKTSGHTFSFRKHLNWRFDSIHGETFFKRNDVRRWNVFAWKLIPKKGQLYFKSGANKGKRFQRNWIVANRQLPVPKQKIETSKNIKTDSSNNNFNPILEKKLEHLKYLYDKKLLNDEEYKTQQNKLFDDLL